MNEKDIAKKISQHLNYGANQLDRSVLLRLQAARQQALGLQAQPGHAFGLAWAAGGDADIHHHGHHHGHHLSLRFWLSLAVLLVALLVAMNWQTMNGEVHDEIDATLLAEEDLPVHAYLDSDFDTWLEQSSQR